VTPAATATRPRGKGARGVAPVRSARFPALDGLRGAAALMVLVNHVGYESGFSFTGIVGGLVSRLDIGVTIFFVLSGFLLYRPFAEWHLGDRPRPAVRRYAWHRALRILPAYWVLAAVVMLTIDRELVTARVATATALLLQTYQGGLLLPSLGQTWTLCTELSWYVALPALALVLRRRGTRSPRAQVLLELAVVGAFVVIGLTWSGLARSDAGWLDPFLSGFWLPHYLGWFGAGMALAVLWAYERHSPRAVAPLRALGAAPGTCWAAAFAVFALAATPLTGPRILLALSPAEGVARDLLYLVAAGLVVLPCVFGTEGAPVMRALSGRTARYLGEISYAVYLWHFPMKTVTFGWTGTAPFTGHFLLNLAVLLPVTLVLASASWYLVEKPALRLRTWTPRRRHRGTG
jgi:peptidoglycan/LPS O-acetylase OafA/YrhL